MNSGRASISMDHQHRWLALEGTRQAASTTNSTAMGHEDEHTAFTLEPIVATIISATNRNRSHRGMTVQKPMNPALRSSGNGSAPDMWTEVRPCSRQYHANDVLDVKPRDMSSFIAETALNGMPSLVSSVDGVACRGVSRRPCGRCFPPTTMDRICPACG